MADTEHPGRRKEIDKDISSYISLLRKKEKTSLLSFLKKLKGKSRKKDVELHPEVEAYGEEKKHEKQPKEEAEKEEEEIEKEFDEGAKKKTFGQWLKELFMEKREPTIPSEDEIQEAVENAEKEKKIEADAAEEELEDQYVEEIEKEGWFSRLIAKIFVKSREEEELEDAADEIAEDQQDMKVIAEISTKVMKMLPAEQLKEFKQSEEFHMFKEILKKRELIK